MANESFSVFCPTCNMQVEARMIARGHGGYTSADNPFDQACLSTIWELPLPAAGNGHCVLRDVSFTYVQYRGDQRPKPNAAQRMGTIGSDVEF